MIDGPKHVPPTLRTKRRLDRADFTRSLPKFPVMRTAKATLTLLVLVCSLSASQIGAQPSTLQAPAPSPAAVTYSANTSGSLGYYCSNAAGLQALVASASNGQAPAALNVTIPSAVQDSNSLANIASVSIPFQTTFGSVNAPPSRLSQACRTRRERVEMMTFSNACCCIAIYHYYHL